MILIDIQHCILLLIDFNGYLQFMNNILFIDKYITQ